MCKSVYVNVTSTHLTVNNNYVGYIPLVIESEMNLEHLWSKHAFAIQEYEFMMQY